MKRRIRLLFIIAAVVLCLFAIVVTVMHRGQEGAVEAYKRELVAKGEKLTIAENIPPPVPDEQNSAEIVRRAIGLFGGLQTVLTSNAPSGMKMVAPGKARVAWAQPDIHGYDNTNTWEDMAGAMEWNQAGLTLLEQLMTRPIIDFQLDYGRGFTLSLPHLAPMKAITIKLCAAAIYDLHHGDTESATTRIRTSLALARGMGSERLIISQLVSIAMSQITLTAIWELLQSPNVAEADLAALQYDLEKLEFTEGYENAFSMERAMAEMTIARLRKSPAEIHSIYGFSGSGAASSGVSGGDWYDQATEFVNENWRSAKSRGKEFIWQVAWSYPDQLRSLKGYQVLLEAVRMVKTNESFANAWSFQTNKLGELGILVDEDHDWLKFIAESDGIDLRRMFTEGVQTLSSVLRRLMFIEISGQLTIAAIALKRFELKNGHHPETLSELCPDFLSAVPSDPVDGQPLRYSRNADGTFQLYSIGEDGVDDGGNPYSAKFTRTYIQQNGRDYVWPAPATDEEIRLFEETRPK